MIRRTPVGSFCVRGTRVWKLAISATSRPVASPHRLGAQEKGGVHRPRLSPAMEFAEQGGGVPMVRAAPQAAGPHKPPPEFRRRLGKPQPGEVLEGPIAGRLGP